MAIKSRTDTQDPSTAVGIFYAFDNEVGTEVEETVFTLMAENGTLRREEIMPILTLSIGPRLRFHATGFDKILLTNFHMVEESDWPSTVKVMESHLEPRSFDGFVMCKEEGNDEFFCTLDLPGSIAGYIRAFLESRHHVKVKFDLLARLRDTGKWLFVDPGTGIKP